MIDVDRLHGEDRQYFTSLIEEHGGIVHRIARDYSSDADEADDLFQDIWLHVWKRKKSFRGKGSFRGWLLALARNVCRDRLRREGRYSRSMQEMQSEPVREGPTPLDEVITEEQRAALFDAILDLPTRQREAVFLRLNDHMSAEDAAEAMGVKPATVRSLVRNGVATLAQTLRSDP